MTSGSSLVLRAALLPTPTEKIAHPPGTGEFLQSVTFWLLGSFIVVNGIWIQEQFDRYMDLTHQARFTAIQSPKAAELLKRPTPTRFFWLQPYINSRSRQVLAVILCGLVVPLQLLELSWVYKLGWRLSVMAFRETCACGQARAWEHGLLRILWCLAAMATVMAAWLFLAKKSLGWIFTQLSYTLGLASLRPEAPLDLSHKEAARRGQSQNVAS